MKPNHEDITVELKDGRIISWDKGDFSRFAPAAVCNIAGKIQNLRKIIKDHGGEIPGNVLKKLEVIASPYSFESNFSSSNVVEVHGGIEKLGSLENKITELTNLLEEIKTSLGGCVPEKEHKCDLLTRICDLLEKHQNI